MKTITINVREYCGTYIARAQGLNKTASCTSSAEQAAKRVAGKLGAINMQGPVPQPDGWLFTAELPASASVKSVKSVVKNP